MYFITQTHFFFILDEYDEFGTYLLVLLGVIIAVSGVWFALGIRQYMVLKSWNQRYAKYLKKKEQVEDRISTEFDLDENQET